MKYFKSGLSREELKKEYKALAKKFHPDVSKDPNAEIIFKEINEEYTHYTFSSASSYSKTIYDDFFNDNFKDFYSPFADFFGGFAYGGTGPDKSRSAYGSGGNGSYNDNRNWYAGGGGTGYGNTWRNKYGGSEFDIIFFKKVNQHYEGMNSLGVNVDFFPNKDDHKNYDGFQVVYRNYSQIVPEVHVHPTLRYVIPSDVDMIEYFLDTIIPEELSFTTDWIGYIKRNYKVYKYWAFDGANGECYGGEMHTFNNYTIFDYYACCSDVQFEENTDIVKYTMHAKYSKYFKVRETLNWFDFPLRYCCNCTFEEFVKSYTVEVPPQMDTHIDYDEGARILASYHIGHLASYEVIEFHKISRHKDVVFGCFNILKLVQCSQIIKPTEIKLGQKAIDEINSKSMEKLKNLIKKRKVPGFFK